MNSIYWKMSVTPFLRYESKAVTKSVVITTVALLAFYLYLRFYLKPIRSIRLATPLKPTCLDSPTWKSFFNIEIPSFQLTSEIKTYLQAPCPFWKGHRVEETHDVLLVYSPNKKMTFSDFDRLCTAQLAHTLYTETTESILKNTPDSTAFEGVYWALIPKQPLNENLLKKGQQAGYELCSFHEYALYYIMANRSADKPFLDEFQNTYFHTNNFTFYICRQTQQLYLYSDPTNVSPIKYLAIKRYKLELPKA